MNAAPAARRRYRANNVVVAIARILSHALAISWIASLSYLVVKLHGIEYGRGMPSSSFSSRSTGVEEGEGYAMANEKEDETGDENDGDGIGGPHVHVVFSTDCSNYQHWQSISSYYALRRAGHLGRVTRIVSGCDNSLREDEIRSEMKTLGRRSYSSSMSLEVHFTPSHALAVGGGGEGGKGDNSRYKYSNKPGGMLDWIISRNKNRTITANNMTNAKMSKEEEEEVVVLIDPDMLALRPVFPDLGMGLRSSTVRPDVNTNGGAYRDLVEYVDDAGNAVLLRHGKLPPLPSRITRGVAAGQHFGLGGKWATANTPDAGRDFANFNLSYVCGNDSPCLNVPPSSRTHEPDHKMSSSTSRYYYTTRELADTSYAVGPVYIATNADWSGLLPRWHDFTPRVHEQYPRLLAEMFAFTMAAADMRLKFALSSSYMVSDPRTMSSTESWMWIDEYASTVRQPDGGAGEDGATSLRRVCEGATPVSLPIETARRLEDYGYGYRNDSHRGDHRRRRRNRNRVGVRAALPTFLHYCQNYKLSNHSFGKRRIAHDFFRCDGSPLYFDASALVRELDIIEDNPALSLIEKKIQTRTGFMLCHIIPLMNMALIEYKLDVCDNEV